MDKYPYLRRLPYFAVPLLIVLAALVLPGLAQASSPPPAQATGQPGSKPTSESWIILPTMSPDATQADYGQELYILVCQSCHGDLGRGLTSQWIAQWAPDDRNCWQSKCHASNHPQDGFEIPKYVPPVIGDDALRQFETALDLYGYLKAAMPMQAPGTMLDREYWQVTAYLLRANGVESLPAELDAEQAALIALRPQPTAPAAALAGEAAPSAPPETIPAAPRLVPLAGRILLAGSALLAVILLARSLARR